MKVLVFRALLLGDMLCAVPALRALRKALPEAHITLMGLPWASDLPKFYPQYLDSFIPFPGYPGLPEITPQVERWPSLLAELQQRQFDLVIQMHGSGSIVNPMVATFGAHTTAGYYLEGGYCPDAATFIPYPEKVPEIWRHLSLMKHLGADELDVSLEFPVHLGRAEMGSIVKRHGIAEDASIVCIHPGAKAAWRRWPAENFAKVADEMAAQNHVVVVTGTRDEFPLADAIIKLMRLPAHNLAGAFTDISSLAALYDRSTLLICGDTGVSHLACAVQCPSVVLFLRSEVDGWPPLDRVSHRVVSDINGITPEAVLQAATEVLHQNRGPSSTHNHHSHLVAA